MSGPLFRSRLRLAAGMAGAMVGAGSAGVGGLGDGAIVGCYLAGLLAGAGVANVVIARQLHHRERRASDRRAVRWGHGHLRLLGPEAGDAA